MKLDKLLLGFCTGVIAGAILSQSAQKKTMLTSESALEIAKKAFKENGPIDGSWIYAKPEQITKYNLPYKIYRGGITRTINDKVEQYEFLIDAKTGSILEVKQI
ncbi:PepSY domain-containing protein [Calidifontibacillus erzurumensis]|uniref:PepSY domain-containing protein n=1 Tax=Calidifontibacillus erzurumensis TaxID=2741433 RepID=A0A8J8GCU3_9BACI|nr:PepSY domain-containing protein [Calidifontibacillus erzurumensis]NSL51332.1 PepSY domain-containing protein [Calidifontibacillus erzurumensis]